jgi:hypothetical protein
MLVRKGTRYYGVGQTALARLGAERHFSGVSVGRKNITMLYLWLQVLTDWDNGSFYNTYLAPT